MREYKVSELTGNEILAKPVCLENGSIILEIGTVLKVSYKESLAALNVRKIFIEDPFEKYEKANFFFEQKVFLEFENDLKEILSHHIYHENTSLRKLANLGRELVKVFEATKEKRALDVWNRTPDMYEHTIFITILVMILGKEYGFPENGWNMQFWAAYSMIWGTGILMPITRTAIIKHCPLPKRMN